jgi:hypothetical protein
MLYSKWDHFGLLAGLSRLLLFRLICRSLASPPLLLRYIGLFHSIELPDKIIIFRPRVNIYGKLSSR